MTTAPQPRAGPAVRVPPAPRRTLRPLARVVAAGTARATRGEPPRVFTTLGRHPRLFRTWLRFSATLMLRGDLPAADRELVTLRTAWRCGSWYEWAQHVPLARRAGLGADDIARVVDDVAAPVWAPRQRLLLSAVDELHDHRVISDATWRALASELTDRQLIELCMVVGHYEMLAMTLNSLGVEPERTALARLGGATAEAAERLRKRLLSARGG